MIELDKSKNIHKKFKCHAEWTPCIWEATRKGVIIMRLISLFYTGVSRYLYTDIERRRIFSRAIIPILYSAFADTDFTTENNRVGAERREIKKEYEKHL